MQHLEVSGAVRHIYIYVIRRLKVNCIPSGTETHIRRLYTFSNTAVRTSDLTIPVARLVHRSLDRITGFGDLVRDK